MCFQALVSPFNIYNCYCYNKTFLLLFANAAPQKNVRKKTIGHGLEKMINRGKKLAIEVAEGKKRPEVPLQAAKLALECGVALRDNLPIYTSWKDYDNEQGQAEVSKVLRKVVVRQLFHSSKYFHALQYSHVKIVSNNSFVWL